MITLMKLERSLSSKQLVRSRAAASCPAQPCKCSPSGPATGAPGWGAALGTAGRGCLRGRVSPCMEDQASLRQWSRAASEGRPGTSWTQDSVSPSLKRVLK